LVEGAIVYENKQVLRPSATKLRGSHNIENLMATLAAGMARGLSFEEMVPPLSSYEPQPHRCEFVRQVGGVDYVNDSKATNLDAVEKALLAQTKPVVLIAGGKDKGFIYEPLRALVKEKVRSTILIGEMAGRIARDWKDAVKCEIANSLADAVERAHSAAKPGEVVLFSPGTSSFDMFKSYADRGDQFRALVRGHVIGGTNVAWQLTLAATFDWFALGMALAVGSVAYHGRERRPRAVRVVESHPSICWALAVLFFWILSTRIGLTPQFGQPRTVLQASVEHVVSGLVALFLLLPAVFGDHLDGLPRRILRWRPLAWLGLISYGVFLWHLPILAKLSHTDAWGHSRMLGIGGVGLLISVGCAAASYYLVERPLLRFK